MAERTGIMDHAITIGKRTSTVFSSLHTGERQWKWGTIPTNEGPKKQTKELSNILRRDHMEKLLSEAKINSGSGSKTKRIIDSYLDVISGFERLHGFTLAHTWDFLVGHTPQINDTYRQSLDRKFETIIKTLIPDSEVAQDAVDHYNELQKKRDPKPYSQRMRELVRTRHAALGSQESVARSIGVTKKTVWKYLKAAT